MRNLYTCLFLLATTISFAQLSVKPSTSTDNYMYVKGTVLYVGDDVSLTENTNTDIASIYLREEAQLVQGRTTTSQNSGTGKISLFQEGTANQYAYNYWASPVSSTGGASGNLNFSITSLSVPITNTLSNPINIKGGHNSSTSNGGILNLAHYWIYKFISSDGVTAPNWIQVKSQEIISAGEGFTMKGVSGTDITTVNGVQNNPGANQRFDFRGRPNDGLITIPVVGNSESYLIGNPYPSALSLNYFLLENSGTGNVDISCTNETVTRRNATTGIAYFWSSDPSISSHNTADYVGGYASYSPNGNCSSLGIYTPPTYYNYNSAGEPVDGSGEVQPVDNGQFRRFLPIGQGFFIQSATSGTVQDIQFKNTHREYIEESAANQSFFGRGNDNSTTNSSYIIPKIRFNIAFDDDYTRQIALAFDDDATTNVDIARDALNFYTISSDGGFLLNNKNYTIDVRPYDETDRIPLYLDLSVQRDISISINNFENFTTNDVYIYDKDTETYHSILNSTFFINLPAGNYSERFEITFKNQDENLDVADEIAESFTVFQNNDRSVLEVINPMGVDLKSVSVYDMTGKQVINNLNVGVQERYTFSTANLAESVYIVKILTKENIVTTKKISVLNRG